MKSEQSKSRSERSLVERLRECSAKGAARDELLKTVGELKALGFPFPDSIVHWSDLMGEAADVLTAIPSEQQRIPELDHVGFDEWWADATNGLFIQQNSSIKTWAARGWMAARQYERSHSSEEKS